VIREWHICISGFRQDLAHRSGTEQLYNSLRLMAGPEVDADLRLWNEDWDAYAAYLMRNSEPDAEFIIFGYSWGGGWGAMKLIAALGRLQKQRVKDRHAASDAHPRVPTIPRLILCDAVYRSPWTPDWLPLNPKSLLPHPKIKIPANVGRVTWFTQTNNKPAGHTVVAREPDATTIDPGIDLTAEGVNHGTIDEHPAVHSAMQRACGIPF